MCLPKILRKRFDENAFLRISELFKSFLFPRCKLIHFTQGILEPPHFLRCPDGLWKRAALNISTPRSFVEFVFVGAHDSIWLFVVVAHEKELNDVVDAQSPERRSNRFNVFIKTSDRETIYVLSAER